MKTAVGGCALIGAGIVKLVVAYLIVRDPAQKAAWLSLVLIGGSTVLVTLGVLSIFRALRPSFQIEPSSHRRGRRAVDA